jgi:hypothetical protein
MNVQRFNFDPETLRAILWQYNNSENLQSLITDKADWYGVNWSQFWDNWYDDVFNLETANDFGLAVWSILLNLPLYASQDPSPTDYQNWGFADYGFNFDNGNFATDSLTINGLTITERRMLLRLRYWQLVSRGAVPETNVFLNRVFGDGVAYVLDNLDMTITYFFTEAISANLLYVLQQFDILPRPAGVMSNIVVSSVATFGFDPYCLNFDNGNFP